MMYVINYFYEFTKLPLILFARSINIKLSFMWKKEEWHKWNGKGVQSKGILGITKKKLGHNSKKFVKPKVWKKL